MNNKDYKKTHNTYVDTINKNYVNKEELVLPSNTNFNEHVYISILGMTPKNYNLYLINAFFCYSLLRHYGHTDKIICYYLGENEKLNNKWLKLFEPFNIEWRDIYDKNLPYPPMHPPKWGYQTTRPYIILNTEYYNCTVLDPDVFCIDSHNHLKSLYDLYVWQMPGSLIYDYNTILNSSINENTLDFIFGCEMPTAKLRVLDVPVFFYKKSNKFMNILSRIKFWSDNADFYFRYSLLEMHLWHYSIFKTYHKDPENIFINSETVTRQGHINTDDFAGFFLSENNKILFEHRAGNKKPFFNPISKKVEFPIFNDDPIIDIKLNLLDKLNRCIND